MSLLPHQEPEQQLRFFAEYCSNQQDTRQCYNKPSNLQNKMGTELDTAGTWTWGAKACNQNSIRYHRLQIKCQSNPPPHPSVPHNPLCSKVSTIQTNAAIWSELMLILTPKKALAVTPDYYNSVTNRIVLCSQARGSTETPSPVSVRDMTSCFQPLLQLFYFQVGENKLLDLGCCQCMLSIGDSFPNIPDLAARTSIVKIHPSQG